MSDHPHCRGGRDTGRRKGGVRVLSLRLVRAEVAVLGAEGSANGGGVGYRLEVHWSGENVGEDLFAFFFFLPVYMCVRRGTVGGGVQSIR